MRTVIRHPLVGLGLIALASAGLPLLAHGQPETTLGTIAGKVYEQSSRTVLADAQVTAKLITTNQIFASGRTDARGSYLISEVPPGIYAFTLEYQGLEYPVAERLDSRVPTSFLLESCFLLDLGKQTASVLKECKSELYAETQVVSIGPHRFFRTSERQEETALFQTELSVLHTSLECLVTDLFPQVIALVEPDENVQSCRVYFRAEQYPDFYYVEMQGNGDNFTAVLPKPSPETERIIYYIEAIDLSFNNAQTPEASPEVTDSETCDRKQPGAAYFTGENPDIVVGAVTAGVPAIPLGFQATGITGFVSATGVVTSVGAAAGAGSAGAASAAAAAVGAGAAGAGGVAAGTVLIVSGAAAAAGGVITATTGQVEASGVVKQ